MSTSISEATWENATIRWPKSLYFEMADMGWFRDKRVELIRGEIIQMAPMGTRHFISLLKANRVLSRKFSDEFYVGLPGILDLSMDTEPEADLIVLRTSVDNLTKGNGENTVLVVEISNTSLRYDRKTKVELYAEAQLQEYWIVNLVENVVEVFRDPRRAVSNGTTIRAHYAEMRTYQMGEVIAPLAQPNIQILVEDLLPPVESES